ncbi:MAG TPA: hypothetical protein VMI72_12820 [Roseiarcus sp.]|nr:hypothetical protein [Roseiarcus sp.]
METETTPSRTDEKGRARALGVIEPPHSQRDRENMATDRVLQDAIDETNKDIFAKAFDLETLTHDHTGDRTAEAMGDGLEGQIEDEDEDEDEEAGDESEASEGEEEGKEQTAEAGEKEGDDKAEGEKGEDPPRQEARVPSGRLREEAEKTRAAQAERDQFRQQLEAERAENAKAIAELNAKFEGFMAAARQAPPQQKPIEPPKPETPPDVLEDPAGYQEFVVRQAMRPVEELRNQVRADRINHSMELAQVRHGEVFTAGFEALKSLDKSVPENRALVERIVSSPNPGEAVVDWHRRNEVMREVGTDPAAYRARIAEEARKSLMDDPEFRKQLLEDLRAEAMGGAGGKPRSETRIPPSLNRTPGNNNRNPSFVDRDEDTENAIFNRAFK